MKPVRYHPGNFPPKALAWERLIPLIGPASAALARYDGVLSAVPNANLLLTPLTTQEAVLSSKIEGTQTTMGEVLEYEAQGKLFGSLGSGLDIWHLSCGNVHWYERDLEARAKKALSEARSHLASIKARYSEALVHDDPLPGQSIGG